MDQHETNVSDCKWNENCTHNRSLSKLKIVDVVVWLHTLCIYESIHTYVQT